MAPPVANPALAPLAAPPGLPGGRPPKKRGPRKRGAGEAAARAPRPAVSERGRGVRLDHATRRVATLSRALRDATGSNAEGHDSDSRQGRNDANPQPRWVVRHEGPQEVAGTLQRPHGARQEENHAEDYNDRTHAARDPRVGHKGSPHSRTSPKVFPIRRRLGYPVIQEVEPLPPRWEPHASDEPRVRHPDRVPNFEPREIRERCLRPSQGLGGHRVRAMDRPTS